MGVTAMFSLILSARGLWSLQRPAQVASWPTDDLAIYRKADLVANWYKRNLRIFDNINRITERARQTCG